MNAIEPKTMAINNKRKGTSIILLPLKQDVVLLTKTGHSRDILSRCLFIY